MSNWNDLAFLAGLIEIVGFGLGIGIGILLFKTVFYNVHITIKVIITILISILSFYGIIYLVTTFN